MSDLVPMNDSLPDLHVPWPQCSHCGQDVEIEDGVAYCERCLVEWADISDGAVSKPDAAREGTDVPCEIESRAKPNEPHESNGRRYTPGPFKPCILPSGHEGDHLHPYDVEVVTR